MSWKWRWECKSCKEEKDSSALEVLTSCGRGEWQEKRQQQQGNWGPERGHRPEGTHRRGYTETRLSGRLPGGEGMHTSRKLELPGQSLCQGERSVCVKAGVREEAWFPGVAQRWPGPEQGCRKVRLARRSQIQLRSGKTTLWAIL